VHSCAVHQRLNPPRALQGSDVKWRNMMEYGFKMIKMKASVFQEI
jgi:hypothetical protein